MNKSLKRILPILLTLVVLGSIVWYMFVYDRNFTRDMLLTTARYFERNGNQVAASTFYDWAYKHSNNDESVAIELANQFKNNGNYTKAEYTLTNAISNGGSINLYLALCNTYVEQNKLLDAVTMLDNISDPALKAQLDAMRPAAPSASPTPGFYNQYKTVTISCETGTLYASTNGLYPSASNGAFPGNYTLVSGENTIRALAVGSNGLVSELAVFSYTVGGVIEEVSFAEPSIESLVRQYLGKDPDAPIMSNELWNITTLTLPSGLTTLADLKLFPYLQILSLQDSTYENLQILSELTYLQGISVTGCVVTPNDLSAIASLPNLTALVLANCGISNINPLSAATKLEALDLHSNTINDISAISSMVNLHTLNLKQNALTDLSALSNLPALQTLSVSANSLTTLAPLSTVTSLTALDASVNILTDLTGLEGLGNLSVLHVPENVLTDITALSQLSELVTLDISNNAITDISMLGNLNKLETLNFSHNKISTLPKWSDGAALISIEGSNNKITAVTNLKNLINLNLVDLQYNEIKKVDDLASCLSLYKVNVFGNKVKDASALTKLGIIVIYAS